MYDPMYDPYAGDFAQYDIGDYIQETNPGFRVDNISISGNTSTNRYDLSMSGIYNWTPPFIYMYVDIKGQLAGGLKTGYFLGFTGCGWNDWGQEVDGIASFFYVASDETGGLFIGDISGDYYPDTKTWSASGSLDWVQLGSGISYPGSIDQLTLTDYPRDAFLIPGSDNGDFYDLTLQDVGDINLIRARGIFDSIAETQYWGYWQTEMLGSYSVEPDKSIDDFDDWFLEWEQKGFELHDPDTQNLHLYMSAHGATSHYEYGELVGDAAGGWVDIEHAVSGIAVGEIHGGYDPYSSSTEFFAASGGVWLKTSQFLTMAGVIGSTPNTDGLDKLHIPWFQIGQAALTQQGASTNGNLSGVSMNDVYFFAYTSATTAPRIWATNNVTGNYSGNPLNDSAVLTGNGLNANFSITDWNTGTNKWAAGVQGAGTYTGGGTMSGTITMKGGAAGTIDSGADFSGTGAGWAKKN